MKAYFNMFCVIFKPQFEYYIVTVWLENWKTLQN